jgi:hypothetical protein
MHLAEREAISLTPDVVALRAFLPDATPLPAPRPRRDRRKLDAWCDGCRQSHRVTSAIRQTWTESTDWAGFPNGRYYCPIAQRRRDRWRRARRARQVIAKAAHRAIVRGTLRCVVCRKLLVDVRRVRRTTARYCTPACSMKAYRARRRQAARRARGQTSSTTMSDKMEYLSKIPSGVPDGRVVVHNTVRPAGRLGTRGFRAWFDEPSERLEVCGCDWAPELSEHYRVKWGESYR